MRKRTLACLTVALLGLLCVESFAYVTYRVGWSPVRWAASRMVYHVNPNKGPTGCVGAIRRAASTWSSVPGSSFEFVFGGRTTATGHGRYNRQNLISFGPLADAGTLAENVYWYDTTTGQMLDSDTRFNTNFRYSATTPPQPRCYDVQNIATHELGHSLPLGDLYGSAAVNRTMYGYTGVREVIKRSLAADDMAGQRALYP